MSLDMLLQVLRTLESLAAKLAFVRLQRNMYADMRSDVVALDSVGTAVGPLASQAKVVCALPSDMAFTDVFLEWLLVLIKLM